MRRRKNTRRQYGIGSWRSRQGTIGAQQENTDQNRITGRGITERMVLALSLKAMAGFIK